MHYAEILFVTLILVASRPSNAHAVPVMRNAFGPQAASHEPNPDASGTYHPGDGVSTPKLLFAPDPEFTDEARHRRVQGVTVISLTVDISGHPQDVRVSRSMAET